MANKPNAFLARMEAQYRAMSAHKVNVALQMAKDVADIAANIDERLKQINGKHFQPWEVRYNV